jgi:hypothetical protein
MSGNREELVRDFFKLEAVEISNLVDDCRLPTSTALA